MNILLWIIFGALVGWVASLIVEGSGQQNIALDVVVGIIGAFLGGFVMNLFGLGGVSGFNWYSFITAIIGAVVLLAIVRALRGGDTTTSRPYRA